MAEEMYNNIYRSRKKMMLENFLGGVAWSAGTIIGGTILLIILGLMLSKIDFIPIIGSFVRQVSQEAFQNTQTPVKLPPKPSVSPSPSPTETAPPTPTSSPLPSPNGTRPPESTSSAR